MAASVGEKRFPDHYCSCGRAWILRRQMITYFPRGLRGIFRGSNYRQLNVIHQHVEQIMTALKKIKSVLRLSFGIDDWLCLR